MRLPFEQEQVHLTLYLVPIAAWLSYILGWCTLSASTHFAPRSRLSGGALRFFKRPSLPQLVRSIPLIMSHEATYLPPGTIH